MFVFFCSAIVLSVFVCACSGFNGYRTLAAQDSKSEYISIGSGTPVIVFENGMGMKMDTWDALFRQLGHRHRLFAYNRPGYGGSYTHPPLKKAVDIAEELRNILKKTGHHPPYILVGHSMGGIYINLFARMYPHEVKGVVFIDSSHPEQYAYQKKHDPWFEIGKFAVQGKDTAYEFGFMETIEKEFIQAGQFPQIPLIVLTSGKTEMAESAKTRLQWIRFQDDLASLSKRSEHRIVKNSGHFIYIDQPEVVIKAIRKVANRVR
ncbi:alpha/beta hydrolase [Desulfococcaceae bacterium HSG7]|nr:alpha/beta hydrolase [Desulfococcaceae bacterium HSG7]